MKIKAPENNNPSSMHRVILQLVEAVNKMVHPSDDGSGERLAALEKWAAEKGFRTAQAAASDKPKA